MPMTASRQDRASSLSPWSARPVGADDRPSWPRIKRYVAFTPLPCGGEPSSTTYPPAPSAEARGRSRLRRESRWRLRASDRRPRASRGGGWLRGRPWASAPGARAGSSARAPCGPRARLRRGTVSHSRPISAGTLARRRVEGPAARPPGRPRRAPASARARQNAPTRDPRTRSPTLRTHRCAAAVRGVDSPDSASPTGGPLHPAGGCQIVAVLYERTPRRPALSERFDQVLRGGFLHGPRRTRSRRPSAPSILVALLNAAERGDPSQGSQRASPNTERATPETE